jgi:hypothetical protein
MEDKLGRSPALSWPAAVIAIALLLIGAGLFVFERLRTVPEGALREGRAVLGDLKKIAEAFSTGTVVTSFLSYATEVSGSSYFQFATVKQLEVFERKDSRATLWGQLQLPDVVVEARAPVTYTYYLDLDDEWKLRLEGRTIRVRAPAIRHNPPAVDASAIRYEVRNGSAFRSEADALTRLKAGITSMAELRAAENVALVRELGRRKTAGFVEQWLARGFSDADEHAVIVVFADELPEPAPGSVRVEGGPEGAVP